MNILILKLIALTTMIIDHIGSVFFEDIGMYRYIGRLAFPIYCFILVEGYTHTKNIKKYATRLLIFALISEIPFDLVFAGRLELGHQNIFFTLFIGIVTMYLIDNAKEHSINQASAVMLGVVACMLLSVDYGFMGLLYILTFFYTKSMRKNKRFIIVALSLIVINTITFSNYQNIGLLSLPLLYMYNGKLGPKNKTLQQIFYVSYPLHLFIIYVLK